MILPRISGSAVETDGGWKWEAIVSELGSDYGKGYSTKEVFKTKQEAINDLRNFAKFICDEFIKAVGGENNGKYFDLNSKESRKWDEH